MMFAVIACDEFGVTVDVEGPDPDALVDKVASWAQQEEDVWPQMGLLYMLISDEEIPLARALERRGTKED